MLVAPSRDWNVFKPSFAEHWDGCTHAQPRYQTAYSHGLVAKRLDWGNPDKMGSSAYRCLHWGQGKHLVAMSCTSSLGLRCAKVYVDTWVSQVSQRLHAGVI
jgi:Transposase zinc-binding domain